MAEGNDLLILNLASRKQFWTQKKLIAQNIKARTTNADNFGFDFDNRRIWSGLHDNGPCGMKVGLEKIEIKYNIDFKNQGVTVELGCLKCQN